MARKEISYYQNLLDNPNIRAYLQTIRKGEGTFGPNGYSMLVGGGRLTDFRRHPKVYKPKYNSTAAGAYQFKFVTWEKDRKSLSLPDFTPRSQDIAALFELNKAGAINDILKGDIVSAINKTKGIWVSLPGTKHDVINKYSQSLTGALKFYQDHGGILNMANQDVVINGLRKKNDQKLPENIPYQLARRTNRIIANTENNRADYQTDIPPASKYFPSTFATIADTRKNLTNIKNEGEFFGTLAWLLSLGTSQPKDISKTIESKSAHPSMNFIRNLQKQFIKKEELESNSGQLMESQNSSNATRVDEVASWFSSAGNNEFVPGNFIDERSLLLDSLSLPNRVNLVSEVEKRLAPAKLKSVNDQTGTVRINQGIEYLYKKYPDPKPLIDHISRDAIHEDSDTAMQFANKHQLNAGKGSRYNGSPDRVININLNKPMIENFTINARDTKEGINDFKHKVEEALLEILNSANAIQ